MKIVSPNGFEFGYTLSKRNFCKVSAVAQVKAFHSELNAQCGASLIVLLIGLALSAISVAAASAFFVQSNAKAKALMGESESISHLALLLKQSFTKNKCLELDMYEGKFRKSIAGPFILTSAVPAAAPKAGGHPMNDKSIALLKNALGKSYDVSRVQMIQRTGVMGRDPGRVLADLKVQVIYRGPLEGQKLKLEPQTLVVPLLFDVDDKFRAIGCMDKPLASEICNKNQGIFDEKATDQICALKK
jgi:hypothetical protein